jgi:DNA-directed RNA polymerase II subunit RPB3
MVSNRTPGGGYGGGGTPPYQYGNQQATGFIPVNPMMNDHFGNMGYDQYGLK